MKNPCYISLPIRFIWKRKLFVVVFFFLCEVIASAQDSRIRLATTTSTDHSGLFYVLNPPFEELTGFSVDVIAVGTGKALKLGENGDADVVFVHAREAEDRFIAGGWGVSRRDVMHNDFVLVGPARDTARVGSTKSILEALRIINRAESTFLSRGDDSGTNKKEILLWELAGISPKGRWYKEAGQGMGAVLTITNNLQGYTLTDRGTYLSMKEKLDLTIVSEGDALLHNPYGVIAVNPAKHPFVNYRGAMAYIAWLTSIDGQRIIGNFTKFDEILFYPDAVPLPDR